MKRIRRIAGALGRALAAPLRCRRGSAAVEYAMIIGPLMTVMFGIYEFSRYMWVRQSLQHAVEETARFVIATSTVGSEALTQRTKNNLMGVDPASVTVLVTADAVAGVNFVTITAQQQFQVATELFDFSQLTVTGRARVPITP